jgi:hypothetical protein
VLLKRRGKKEVKKDLKLDGQWGSILFNGQSKVPSLMANGETFCSMANERFQA